MKIEIPENLQFLFRPKRFKILFGGRGGYKTVSLSKALLFLCHREKKRLFCFREFMNTIEDSVHASLSAEIKNLNMGDMFKIGKTQISALNGSLVRYDALARHSSSIKSKDRIDIAWIEEAETVSEKSLNDLIPTVRAPGSEIWISFNPDDEFGAVYNRFVKPHLDTIRTHGYYEDEDMYVVKTSLEDNPYSAPELFTESRLLKARNYKEWLHVFGGEVYSDYTESIIQPEWVDASVDAHLKLGFSAQGIRALSFDPADTGDAKALMKRHGSVITGGWQWLDGELPEAIDRAFNEAFEDRSEQLIYDATGIGRGVKVGLQARIAGKNIQVIPYEGGASVDFPDEIYAQHKTHKETFKNKRSQYAWLLRDRFEATFNAVTKKIYSDPDKLISLSSNIKDMDVLKSEIIQIRRIKRSTSYIQLEPKENLKKSPNMFDALKMVFATKPVQPKVIKLNFLSEF